MWLKDPGLLPSNLKNSRILTYGYNATVTAVFGKTSSDRILQHAHTLVAQLVADREVGMVGRMKSAIVTEMEQIAGRCDATADHLRLPLTRWHCRETSKTNRVIQEAKVDYFAGTGVFRKPDQQVHPACAFDLRLDVRDLVLGNASRR